MLLLLLLLLEDIKAGVFLEERCLGFVSKSVRAAASGLVPTAVGCAEC